MKIKIIVAALVFILVLFIGFNYLPLSQAVFDVNLTVRNGGVYVNGSKTNIERTATFSGAPYVPLNLVAPEIDMVYEKNSNESVVSFLYRGNKLTLDFNKKAAYLNGNPYTLLYGVSKKNILNKTHIFVGNYDIQNIFGLIMEYDEKSFTTKINTGFGVIAVDYSQQGGYQSESVMANGKTKLLTYANNIAASTKSSISIVDQTYVSSLIDEVFQSINTPISLSELENGIRIKGLSYKNANTTDLAYIMNIKFLAALANVTVTPEYVKVYKITNHAGEVYVAGVFFAFEGLDISNEDLVTAAVASIEDTVNRTLPPTEYNKISSKVKSIADSLRRDNKMLVFVISKGEIGAIDLL